MIRTLVIALALVLGAAPACQEGTPSRDSPSAIEPLDLNRATTKELERLPRIGEKLARSIIASRNARGGRFRSVDDLLQIDGIGEKTLAAIRPYVYVR